MFGSGRANLALRERYLSDLREVKRVTGFRHVRFHAIFLDDNGVYSEDKFGNPSYNAFALLHELGDERIASSSHDVLVTRRKDGALVVAAWNLVDPDKKAPRLICTWNSRVSTPTRKSP
jgi:hypothetical protein